jgi:putative membrane protein
MACAAYLARSVLSGLAGGLAGAGAMSLGHRLAGAILPKAEAPPASRQKDPTIKVASAITSSVGYELPRSQEPRAGSLVHYGFGATVGALYGAAAGFVPKVAAGVGLPFGVAVWLGAHVITVPALNLSPPPTRRPFRQEAEELGLHLVYGATTDLVRRFISAGESIRWLSSVGSSSV